MWFTSLFHSQQRRSRGNQERRLRHPAPRRQSFRPRLEILEDRTVLSTLTVLNPLDSGAGSLRDTIAAASSGDTIVFDPSLEHQVIMLTGGELALTKSLDIEGPGWTKLTISGNNSSRVFNITGSDVTVTPAGLMITHGLAFQGGGIDNAGTLTVSECAISNNQALGGNNDGANGYGGGIFNEAGATLVVADSTLSGNTAIGEIGNGQPDQFGELGVGGGGGIFNFGVATVSHSTLIGNKAIGKSGLNGNLNDDALAYGFGEGGGIVNLLGTLTVSQSTFTGNQALGGAGAAGADGGCAHGGAIFNVAGPATISSSTFTGNQVISGDGGNGGSSGCAEGGALLNGSFPGAEATMSVDQCTLSDNQAIGGASSGGTFVYGSWGAGGAIANDASEPQGGGPGNCHLILTNSVLTNNQGLGGAGTGPGDQGVRSLGGGSALLNFAAVATVTNTVMSHNRGIGGASSDSTGGKGSGGAIANMAGAVLGMNNSTLSDNQAIGGAGKQGGLGLGGAINSLFAFDAPATATILNSALTNNQAIGGAGTEAGGNGVGAGIANVGVSVLTVMSSLFSDNQAVGGQGGTTGGDGLGGGLYVTDGSAYLARTVVVHNQALGGSGGTAGKGIGGSLHLGGGKLDKTDAVFSQYHASTSDDDVFGPP